MDTVPDMQVEEGSVRTWRVKFAGWMVEMLGCALHLDGVYV